MPQRSVSTSSLKKQNSTKKRRSDKKDSAKFDRKQQKKDSKLERKKKTSTKRERKGSIKREKKDSTKGGRRKEKKNSTSKRGSKKRKAEQHRENVNINRNVGSVVSFSTLPAVELEQKRKEAMAKFQRRFQDCAPKLDKFGRILLREGTLHRQARFKPVGRTCFLFNDLLVFAKAEKGSKRGDRGCLEMRQQIDLRKVTLNNQTSGKTSMKHCICLQTPEREYVVGASSMETIDEWVKDITGAIMKLREVKKIKELPPLDMAVAHLKKLAQESGSKKISQIVELLVRQQQAQATRKLHRKVELRHRMMSAMQKHDGEVVKWLRSDFDVLQKSQDPDNENLVDDEEEEQETQAGVGAVRLAQSFINSLAISGGRKRCLVMCRRVNRWVHMRKEIEMQMRSNVLRVASVEEEIKKRVEIHTKKLREYELINYYTYNFTAQFLLSRVTDWFAFDTFRLDGCTAKRPLSVLMTHLFEKHDLFHDFKLSRHVFARWLTAIEAGYHSEDEVPYHNRLHAADVVQNVYCMFQHESYKRFVTKTDLLASLLAAAVHDFSHPGTNNAFLVATASKEAIQFNDTSVLESMHCAESFKVLRRPGHNIFEGLPAALKREVRESMITMVLATDMKHHQELHHKLDSLDLKLKAAAREQEEREAEMARALAAGDRDSGRGSGRSEGEPLQPILTPETLTRKDKLTVLSAGLHCADLGNPTKPRPIMMEWTRLIIEEFFRQGDKEKALQMPVSPMMDRSKPNIEPSQIGFIAVIIEPLYKSMSNLVPEVAAQLEQLEENKQYWIDKMTQRRAEEMQHDDENDDDDTEDDKDTGAKPTPD